MRNAVLVSAGSLCPGAAPARNATVTIQTPPAPNARSFTPQPGVGLPTESATATTHRLGDDVGTTRTTPQVAPATGAVGIVPTPTR